LQAYELSTLTGTQVMLLVASETGHVYTFATRKLQPMITSEAGKQLIQTCLNSPDPPSVGGGDQRMSATGFEETELSYNIADEDSKVRQLIYGHHGHAHLGHPPAPPSHYSLEQSLMQSGYSGGQASPLSHAQYGGHGHHADALAHVAHACAALGFWPGFSRQYPGLGWCGESEGGGDPLQAIAFSVSS